jgi:phenylpropionate dioxygenase-like ring-hydroxylating dioxygenase large terminal subunit
VEGIVTYPINHWYVVASAGELGRELLARTICGQHLVLYRTEAGVAVALDDRCPHRGYPLSAGELIGDQVQCGYHGLRFDSCGTCVSVPGQDRIPSRSNVASRPLVEQGAWVWAWMGAPDALDHGALPSTPWFGDSAWASVDGMEPLPARYGLLIDNLLDLSHETFLHGGFIGTPEVAETPITTSTDEDLGVIHVSRHMEAVECPPFYTESTGFTTPIDRWQDIEYHAPGFYLLHVRVAPSGTAVQTDGSDPDAAHLKVLYAITPKDDHNTWDFWAVSRDFAVGDSGVDSVIAEMNRSVVLQDVVALTMIEQRLGDEWNPVEVSLKIDTGGLAGRRLLAEMISSEQEPSRT